VPVPSWPAKAALSPSSIKGYEACPHRIRLQYIERRKTPFGDNLHLEQGNAAHHLLAEIAHRHRHDKPQRSVDEMYTRAFHRLPKRYFPSRIAHEAAAEEVMRWVDYGVACLDRRADILAVEKPGRRTLPVPRAGVRLELTTRPDLILLRTDPEGERFVDIIDYKTGSKEWVDEIPPVTMRFVFKELFKGISPDTLALRVQFTYVWLAHRETHVIHLTPEYCETAWAQVTGVIERLVTEREWPAQPSGLCHYCPYNGHGCDALARAGEDDAPTRRSVG
jgi:RecB family exonuclease